MAEKYSRGRLDGQTSRSKSNIYSNVASCPTVTLSSLGSQSNKQCELARPLNELSEIVRYDRY